MWRLSTDKTIIFFKPFSYFNIYFFAELLYQNSVFFSNLYVFFSCSNRKSLISYHQEYSYTKKASNYHVYIVTGPNKRHQIFIPISLRTPCKLLYFQAMQEKLPDCHPQLLCLHQHFGNFHQPWSHQDLQQDKLSKYAPSPHQRR